MILTISVPGKDYRAIEKWVKNGRVTMTEIIGREYEIYDGDLTIKARVMDDQPSILYTLYHEDKVTQKNIKSLMCYFQEVGATVVFDIDTSYE